MPIDIAVDTLVEFIKFELWALLGGVAAVVAYQLLTGHINMQGLLNDKQTGKIDPGRIQLLVSTLVVAAAYLGDPHAFADLTTQAGAGAVLGGSNIFYLVQKYRSQLT
jgi:hypothetical protein